MAKKRLNPEAEVEDILDDEFDVEELEKQPTAVSTYTPLGLGEVRGDIDATAVRAPRLAMAYGVGALAENFNPGDWVLEKTDRIASKDEEVEFIITGMDCYWREWPKQFIPGQMPQRFDSETDALQAGMRTRYNAETGKHSNCAPAVDLKILIRKPDEIICGFFGLDLLDGKYAPAEWTLDKTAYRSAGQEIVRLAALSLKARGILSGKWVLYSTSEKTKKGMVMTNPKVKLIGSNTDEEIAEIKAAFGA